MRKTIVALGASTALALGMAPAQAHTLDQYQGADHGWVKHGYTCSTAGDGTCTQHYRYMAIRDRECDGHTAIIQIHTGSGALYTLSDQSGCGDSDSNYNSINFTDPRQPLVNIAEFRVCEVAQYQQPDQMFVACSSWQDSVGHPYAQARHTH